MDSATQTDSACAPHGRRPWRAVLLPFSLVLLAVALRTAEYAHNKAIWLDEAYVALNVLDRDYAGLLKPMEWGQAAPLGFLFAERFAVECAGSGEYALRLVPYLAALAGAVLFWWVLRRWVSAQATPIALALFALSPALTRYAGEVKPYSTDVLVTLVLVALATLCMERMSPIRITALALGGAAAIWCAYPAAFVLAGAGATLTVRVCAQRRWVVLPGLILIGAVWLASFAWYYRVSLRALGGNAEVMGWWAEYFMPLPPRSLADLNWFVRTFFDFWSTTVGVPAVGIAAFAFILGALSLVFRNRYLLLLLLSPLAVALAASGLGRYPFTDRFVLFAVPLALPVLAEGFEVVRKRTRTRLLYGLLAVVMLVQPAIGGLRTLAAPDPAQGVRPAYDYLVERYQRGDVVYLYHWAQFPFRYCLKRDGRDIDFHAGITSRGDWPYYVKDLEALPKNRRVWLVFVKDPKALVGEEEKFFLYWLDTHGTRTDELRARDSSVYCYDLTSGGAAR